MFVEIKDKFAQHLVKRCPKWLKPNHLSALRLLLLVPIIWCLVNERYYLFLFIFLFAYFTDFLDGSLARLRKQKTTLGTFLDPIADKLVFFVSLFLIAYGKISLFLFWLLLTSEAILMIMVLIIVPVLNYIKMKFNFSSNTSGKLKMLAQIGAIILLAFGEIPTAEYLLAISLLLTAGNFFQHVVIDRE